MQRRRYAWLCGAVLVVLAPASALAQDKVEIGAGGGWAHSYHGDLNFSAPAVSAVARLPLSRLIAIDPEFAFWKHSDSERFAAGTEVVETRTAWSFVSLTANAIVHSPSDRRARVYGGGGPGIYFGYHRYEQSATAFFPAYETRRVVSPTFGLQVLGGADGRVHDRLVVFGEFRFEIRSLDDPGSSVARLMGGIRVPIG